MGSVGKEGKDEERKYDKDCVWEVYVKKLSNE